MPNLKDQPREVLEQALLDIDDLLGGAWSNETLDGIAQVMMRVCLGPQKMEPQPCEEDNECDRRCCKP